MFKKSKFALTVMLIFGLTGVGMLTTCQFSKGKRTYKPTWESLSKNQIPEWVKDAKFGVYTHWGVYSVPAYKTNTYCQDMYSPNEKLDKKGVREYHERTYGPVSEFGYKEFVPMFKAEKFDAAEWIHVMREAGAKFGGICLVHHDGFCLWDSKYTLWDSKDKGPKRDIFGEIAREVRKSDMKLLATFHHARTYEFIFRFAKYANEEQRKIWDIFDPQYDDFYRNPETVSKEEFGREWIGKINEVINKYSPDILWFDGLRGQLSQKIIPEDQLLQTFADYFNEAEKAGRKVVICNKLPAPKRWNFPLGFGLRCYENGRDMEANPLGSWLIDRAISYPWTYVEGKKYNLTYQYHISSFVDVVSRGGIFLLSLTPKGDGSIPEEEKFIMGKIGQWLKVNGEGVYGTRPWKIAGEGTSLSELIELTNNGRNTGWNFWKIVENGKDVRFTRKGNTLYAFVLGWPETGKISIKSLSKGNVTKKSQGIKRITMLGSNETITWEQTRDGLTLHFPNKPPCEVAYAFKVEVNGKLDDTMPEVDDGVERVDNFPVFNKKGK